MLEEDIALTNVGLDLLGQARLWLAYAGEVEARFARRRPRRGPARVPARRRRVSQPAARRAAERQLRRHDRRGSSCSTPGTCSLLRALARSRDARIAEIAAKAAKEVAYHVERSGDWVIRLGDGTDESHAKMQAAIDEPVDVHRRDVRRRTPTRSRWSTPASPPTSARSRRPGGSTSTRCSPKRRSRCPPTRTCSRAASRACTPSISGYRARRDAVPAARVSGRAMVSAAIDHGERARGERRRGRRSRAAVARRAVAGARRRCRIPEIPVVSVVELGIVRGIEWDAARSGDAGRHASRRPIRAARRREVIIAAIRDALTAAGVARVRIETQLSPRVDHRLDGAGGARKLRGYGIAPPARRRAPRSAARLDVAGSTCRGISAAAPPARRDARARAAARAHAQFAVAVRLDRVQGALPLRRMPRAVRLFQAALIAAQALRNVRDEQVPSADASRTSSARRAMPSRSRSPCRRARAARSASRPAST